MRSPNSVRFGQPGELVVQRPVLERLRVRLAAGDVADAADRERALADLHLAHVHLHREARAVLAAARPSRSAPRGASSRGQQAPPAPARDPRSRRDGSGATMQLQRLADHLLLAVAEQPSRRPVERLDQPVLAGRHDPVRDVLEHRPRAHLAVAQRRVEVGDRLERALQLLRLQEQVDEGRDLGPQHVGADRREDEVDGAAGVGGGRLGLVAPEGGDEDDRRAPGLAALADQLGGLVAVQRRHPDVHQDHREGLAQDGAQRRAARVGLDDGVAQRREHRPDREALGRVVVDDEDRGGRRRAVATRRSAVGVISAIGPRPCARRAGSHSPRTTRKSGRLDRLGDVGGGAGVDAALALAGADLRRHAR